MRGLWPLRIDQNGRLIKIKAPGIAKNSLNLWEEVPLPYPEPQWKWGLREGGMGRRKVPESSASSSSLSLPGQGIGEYSLRLKANLIRSWTQGLEECHSPYSHPLLPGNSPWLCQLLRLSESHTFCILFTLRTDRNPSGFRSSGNSHFFLPSLEPMGEYRALSAVLGALSVVLGALSLSVVLGASTLWCWISWCSSSFCSSFCI